MNLDILMNCCFVCRKCFNAFKSYKQKGNQLYEATKNSVEAIVSFLTQAEKCTLPALKQNVDHVVPRKRFSRGSVANMAKKRQKLFPLPSV